jgi:phosphatidylglycerophosphatase A
VPRSSVRRFLATFAGAGLLPVAPGTWGSAATVLVLYVLVIFGGNPQAIFLGGLLIFSVLAVAIGNHAETDFGRKDPGPFVLDESAGICLTLLLLPAPHGWAITFLAAFAAFRLFDTTKPPPARQLENLPGGWGILADDLAAAIYANVLCQIALRLI